MVQDTTPSELEVFLALFCHWDCKTCVLGVRPQIWYALLVHLVYKRLVQSAWSYSNSPSDYVTHTCTQCTLPDGITYT